MPGVRLKPRCYLDGNSLRRAVLFSGATTSSGRFFGCDCETGKHFSTVHAKPEMLSEREVGRSEEYGKMDCMEGRGGRQPESQICAKRVKLYTNKKWTDIV